MTKNQHLLLWIVMLGAIRMIGVWSVPIGLIAPALGLFYLSRISAIHKSLLPSYILILVGLIGGLVNTISLTNYLEFMVVLGGIGMAEFMSKYKTADIVDFLCRHMLVLVILLTGVELFFVAMGQGQRIRELSGDVTGGLLPEIGITIPRLMGVRGGSGYSALLAGVFFLICFTRRRYLPAFVYFIIALLMVSRGPFLGLLAAFGYLLWIKFKFTPKIAYVFPMLLITSPAMVFILEKTLSSDQIVYLIAVSTRRFLHYMSFLDFGLENPFFGIGFGGYREYYAQYFYGEEFRQWGFTNFSLIREAHNFALDIIGELGFPAFVLASLQILIVLRLSLLGDAKNAAIIIYMSICFVFLSGLSNWTYWFAIGFILANTREIKAVEKT